MSEQQPKELDQALSTPKDKLRSFKQILPRINPEIYI